MTPEELIEKIAKEISEMTLDWGDDPVEVWDGHRDIARALHAVVREAMREPNGEMKRAGQNALCMWVAPALHADDAWAAMLSHSPLAEPKP